MSGSRRPVVAVVMLGCALFGSRWVHGAPSYVGAPQGTEVTAPDALEADWGELGAFFDNASLRDGWGAIPVVAMPASPSLSPRAILQAEDGPLPRVPRLRLDPAAIPPQYRNMISGFERLPHKNQEETAQWVERRNVLVRRHNARPGARRLPEWTYQPQMPPFSCLAFAASTVYDWWALEMGRALPAYESKNHGRLERGLDPDQLELEYFRRADPRDSYYMLVPREFGLKDPVRRISAPAQPLGYAELLTGPGFGVRDPLTGEAPRFEPEDGVMEPQYLLLFTNRLLRPRTPDKYARVLAEAIDKWGIAYVQIEDTNGSSRLIGSHTMAAVGYFCLEASGERLEEQRLIRCSANADDADWGRTAYFVLHDSFGDFPADMRRDDSGASAYRAARVESIDQAIVFPHGLVVAAVPAGASRWRIAAANRGGRPVALSSLWAFLDGRELAVGATGDGFFVEGPPMQSIQVRVEARHYFEADGGPREFTLLLDPSQETHGREVVRTPPSPNYRDRTGR